ncbi:MAG TPA: helix-turn-helix domain-containing protein [Gemmatimonadaceae bacterium]|nr:helix-turn-helix domain-containing protein [Gemmatimonadaceae bacterium]
MTTTSSARRIPPVSTMVEPVERQRVDAAGVGLYRTIHRDSLGEVMRDLKERRISAVIVSVGRCVREEPAQMAAVVRAFPRVPTLALLSSTGENTAEAVLAVGNCGIRTLVDVREPEGWSRLRALLGREATKDADRAVIAVLRNDLYGVHEDCWRFFEALFSADARVCTVRELARQLNVLPTTLMSRFFRAQLPAPKRYLALARLIRAARLFENPGLSISDVANHLNYSSPQSFGRHIRIMLEITAGEFRCTYDGERMLQRFRSELVHPNIHLLRALRPLAVRPGMRVVPPSPASAVAVA